MADVVGSDEGAEAAGEDVGRTGGRGTTGGAEDTARQAEGAPEAGTEAQTQPAPEPEQAAEAEPEQAAGEPGDVPSGAAPGDGEPGGEPGEAEPEAGPAGDAEPVAAQSAAEAAEEPSAATQAAAESVAVAMVAAQPPAGPAPVSPTAGSGAPPPAPSVFARRKALLIGGGVVVVGAAAAIAVATGSGGGGQATASGSTGTQVNPGGGAASGSAKAPAVPAASITTVPANGATGVDPSKPVTVRVHGGTIESVSLSGQAQTSGTLSTDGSSWTSANVLSVNSGYQLTVTAKNAAGHTVTSTAAFHTLKPSATFGVDSVVPPRGSTVGVGQPIRVTFTNYVPDEYKAALEKACVVTTTPAVAGAWYWVSNSSDGAIVDWRPESFWAVGTKVSVRFDLDGIRLGEHQFGVKNYAAHDFTISDRDLRLIVDKDKYEATCYENGKVIRTFPIDTGVTSAETFVTYTGTMSVLGKGNPVEMKGNYGPNDTYDDFVNWATQITWSGTYVHAAPWDGEIGHANDDSHGCVHCRTEDAEWYYGKVIAGDVVTINGKRKRPVAVANGICTFTLDWASVLKGSAYGATINGKPTSA